MPGIGMLKVTSILMIIFGIIAIIAGIVAIVGVSALGVALGAGAGFVALMVVMGVLALVGAIIELLAGLAGRKCANNPSVQGLRKCMILGIIVLALSIIALIGSGVLGALNGLGIVTGLIIPILYLIGVFQIKKHLSYN
jgi:hypothetical protein